MTRSRLYLWFGRALLAALVYASCAPAVAFAQWVQGPAYPYNAIRDGITPTFDLVGADPTVSPGYDLPIGSIVRFGSSTGIPFYYSKVGFAATEWQIVQGNGPGVAAWPLLVSGSTGARYYCADYDSGNDKRRGYVDAAAGATLSTCSTVAVKTLTKLREIVPSYGGGRVTVLLIKPRAAGATYRNAGNTADEGLDLSGVGGYAYIAVRGSDLTNNASDRITLGAIQGQAGPGGGGQWTVTAGSSTTVTIGSGTFTAEPALIGMRIRFDAATTTAALRNQGYMVLANSGTVITTSTAMAASPAVGDLFYVEQPGVRMASFLAPDYGSPMRGGGQTAAVVAGIAVTSTATGGFGLRTASTLQASFLEATGSTTNPVTVDGVGGNFLSVQQQYPDETGAFIVGGTGLRTAGGIAWSLGSGAHFCLRCAFLHTSAAVAITAAYGQWTGYAQTGFTVTGLSTPGITVGSSTASIPRSRILSGTVRLAGTTIVRALDITNAATAAITLGSSGGVGPGVTVVSSIDDVVGSTGNTGVGIDGSAAAGSIVYLGRAVANTVTGTAGDIKLAGAAIHAHTDTTLTNVVDSADNDWIGSAGDRVGRAILVTNSSGGALAVGNLVKSNGTTAQVTIGKADTNAANAHVECVMVTAPANAAVGYCVGPGGAPYVLYDGAPTVGAIAYLSVGTNAKGTTTVPPVAGTNQKIRLGRVLTASGNTGYTAFAPDWLAVAADGNP